MSSPLSGGCHCGRVRFCVSAALENLLVCNCSICVKKGFWHWIVPTAEFKLISGEQDLSTYVFNTGVARHHFCRHCGIHAFYIPRSDPDKIDVNARCLDGVNLEELSRTLKPFDGQNWEVAAAEHHRT